MSIKKDFILMPADRDVIIRGDWLTDVLYGSFPTTFSKLFGL